MQSQLIEFVPGTGFFGETVRLKNHRITIFATRRKSQCSQSQELITISVASVTVALFYRTILLRKYAHQIPKVSLREVPIDGFLISTPTRQICKTVFENF